MPLTTPVLPRRRRGLDFEPLVFTALLLLLTVGIAKAMPTDDSPTAASRRHADSAEHRTAG